MSILLTLDEITSDKLIKELLRRSNLLLCARRCPYCEKELIHPNGNRYDPITDKEVPDCKCRFAKVSAYHSPNELKPLQYGD
jgi:hypothetical protein